jgi:hypothetical protein
MTIEYEYQSCQQSSRAKPQLWLGLSLSAHFYFGVLLGLSLQSSVFLGRGLN